ncbi:hypothetical protein ACHAXA_000693 [Cyclostephanos tholiformis]|uniref:PNPLA domain-containing protein n=1 Tax=Cyclostephanos tholiformis TaxID=382380 RepID=A0ABD3R1P2_9STRA
MATGDDDDATTTIFNATNGPSLHDDDRETFANDGMISLGNERISHPRTTEERWQRLIDMVDHRTSSIIVNDDIDIDIDIDGRHHPSHHPAEGEFVDDGPSDLIDRNRDGGARRRRLDFFRRNKSSSRRNIIGKNDDDTARTNEISKEEMDCPVVVTNIDELQMAVLVDKIPLRDVGFRFPITGIGSESIPPGGDDAVAASAYESVRASSRGEGTTFQRHDPVINGSLSSLLTYRAKTSADPIDIANYQHGIELMSHHPVLSIVRRRVETKSRPGRRSIDDDSHLALVIEGGGMRGAVSAGMAAALSTLDLLDAFDSIHGSSAGAIVGAYLVSRQLCTDVYTDIMPAAGPRFASRRRGMVNFGVDWLGDLIRRKLLTPSSDDVASDASDDGPDGICVDESDDFDNDNATSWWCEDGDDVSSIELAMGTSNWNRSTDASSRQGRRWTDDHYDGVVLESANYLLSNVFGAAKSYVSMPLLSVTRRLGMALRPALSAIDFASSMRQYLKRRPGMNLTGSWYRMIWMMFKFVPYTLFSSTRKAFATEEFSQPMKDVVEAAALPEGTNAMYGFTKRRKIRNLVRPQEEKKYDPTGRVDDGGGKVGIYPCLEASMLVPGAAGPPIQLIRSKNRQFVEQRGRFFMFLSRRELNRRKVINSHICYDAFCYEPIPYRSAVEKANATHVLALRSRPDGCVVESRQHMYERIVAPLYFRKHGISQVAKLFSSGGSQYRYVEDILTLNAGLSHGITIGRNQSMVDDDFSRGVKIPPTKLLCGTDTTDNVKVADWRRAHLLPINLPFGSPELPPLCQDKDEVIRAVRDGYAAAFDVIAPIAGLPFDSKIISGEMVAKILFPDGDDDISVLDKPVKVKSSYIGEGDEEAKRLSFAAWITKKRKARRKAKDEIASHPDGILARRVQRRTSSFHETDQYILEGDTLEYIETEALLAALPGFRDGRLDHIADNLLANQERKRK